MTKVDVGVPCYGAQHHEWWGQLVGELVSARDEGYTIGRIRAVASALPDHNKNHIVDDRTGQPGWWEDQHKRAELTDANRSAITAGFLSGDADWLWMLDDDVIPPDGALLHLLASGHAFVGGVCYLGRPPHNVTAYMLNSEGRYDAIMDFQLGALFKVDSIGMGCTLIHRSVFEKIMETHEVWERHNGTLFPIHRSQVKDHRLPSNGAKPRLENGYYHAPVRPVSADDHRHWPFFAMEYGRTEEHHFCELAVAAGIHPWLDTFVITEHLKPKKIGRSDHLKQLEALARASGN